MNDIEKIRTLLPHWIDHTKSHGEEFAHWAGHIRTAGQQESATALAQAAAALREVEEHLRRALTLAGGPLQATQPHDEHHHHDHHHDHGLHHHH
ncbi:MAG: hypothetical protein BWK76_26650 [Desulfobulbaceae bacterium A2]|nr:MAG: hypothetical protein BWK76_26650 [Desulfobulbaceae bacterium A2]